MTLAVKNDNKTPIVITPAMRRNAGFRSGQVLEITASGRAITITPRVPGADDEYTPAQRRVIDAELKTSEAEFRAGRTAGAFNSAEEMIAHMKAQMRKRSMRKRSGTRRAKRAR